jgi:hypothetical protein
MTTDVELISRADPNSACPNLQENQVLSKKIIANQHVIHNKGEVFSCVLHVCREVMWNVTLDRHKKLLAIQMVNKYFHIMEPECSLPCSQQPATGMRANVQIPNLEFWDTSFNYIYHLRLYSSLSFYVNPTSNISCYMTHPCRHISQYSFNITCSTLWRYNLITKTT